MEQLDLYRGDISKQLTGLYNDQKIRDAAAVDAQEDAYNNRMELERVAKLFMETHGITSDHINALVYLAHN